MLNVSTQCSAAVVIKANSMLAVIPKWTGNKMASVVVMPLYLESCRVQFLSPHLRKGPAELEKV